LLTPPPSGRFDKRVVFVDELNEQGEVNDQSQAEEQAQVDIPPQPQDLSVLKQFEPGYLSPVARAPINLNPGVVSNFTNNDPFDFMGLPIAIRRHIYKLLLTVPGLICVRQKRTPGGYEPKAFISADDRQLRPGISFVLVQTQVQGHQCSNSPRQQDYPQ
jgi:hypothetical protein